jgi:tetratricopeptide (TPR) repeat protein
MKQLVCCALLVVAAEPAQDAAREHYRKGEAAYDHHDYARAIAEFQQAHDLSNAPALLFNLAQAHRLHGDWAQARDSYRSYLRELPDAPNRADVQTRIGEMDRRLTTVAAPAKTAARAPAKPVHATPQWIQPPRDIESHPGLGLKIGGIAAGVSGLALVGTGLYYGLRANSYSEQAAAGRSSVMFVVGGTAIVGGGVLYGLGVREEHTHVLPTPMAGGGGIVVSGRFR